LHLTDQGNLQIRSAKLVQLQDFFPQPMILLKGGQILPYGRDEPVVHSFGDTVGKKGLGTGTGMTTGLGPKHIPFDGRRQRSRKGARVLLKLRIVLNPGISTNLRISSLKKGGKGAVA